MRGWFADKTRREAYFHGHPWQTTFAALASMVLILLLVLLLAPAVR
jgi:hypothetical protein